MCTAEAAHLLSKWRRKGVQKREGWREVGDRSKGGKIDMRALKQRTRREGREGREIRVRNESTERRRCYKVGDEVLRDRSYPEGRQCLSPKALQ
jgi:hypothetical protein